MNNGIHIFKKLFVISLCGLVFSGRLSSMVDIDQVKSAIGSRNSELAKAMCKQISLHYRLIKAIKRHDFDQVKSCLEECRGSGVDITAKDRETLLTPLQLAVGQGDKRIIVLLQSYTLLI